MATNHGAILGGRVPSYHASGIINDCIRVMTAYVLILEGGERQGVLRFSTV